MKSHLISGSSCNFLRPIISTALIVILFTKKNIKGLNENVMTAVFLCIGLITYSETPVIFGAIDFENE